MKKNIWIMNHYAGSMFFNQGGRHYNFAKYLKQAGYTPVVFCANSRHNKEGQHFEDFSLWHEHAAAEAGIPFVFVKTRTYSGNGKQRVLNMVDFYRNVKKAAKAYAKEHGKPDIIYASSVHPLTLVAGIQLAKYFGVECICEVRDLWPESIVAYSRRFTRTHPVIRLLYQGEKWIYKKADKLIFTMEGGSEYIVDQGWDAAHGGPVDLKKVFHINNGVDLEIFDNNRERFRVEDADLENPNIYKVVYAGSIRRINNLGQLVDAAKLIKNPGIKFLIWGDGDELETLCRRVTDERIDNVVFKGRVEKKYIPAIVSRADLNVVHWEMSSLLKYGESYNKLFEYLAAGRPIFSTVRPGYSIVEQNDCGADTTGFSPEDFAAGIERLAGLSADICAQMGKNAREAAETYDFKALTEKLIKVIEE